MNQKELEIEVFRKLLLEGLPPVIARKDAEKFLGGMISSKTLANADSLGEGPRSAYKVGKNIVYPTIGLVEWLIETVGVISIKKTLELGLVRGR